MKGIVSSLLLALGVGGCAVSKDGVGFASRPRAVHDGVLIVGTTGPLRTLSDAERAEFYRSYVALASGPHSGEASLGEASPGEASPGAIRRAYRRGIQGENRGLGVDPNLQHSARS